jgi:hypothetical protein
LAISAAPSAPGLQFAYLGGVYRKRATLVDARGLRLGDALKLALAARLVSNSANTPSMPRKHLPAAVPVSIGCPVAAVLEWLIAANITAGPVFQAIGKCGKPQGAARSLACVESP